MNRDKVKVLRTEMQRLLNGDLGNHFTVEVGNASFDEDSVTFKVTVREEGALTKTEKDLARSAVFYGLDTTKIASFDGHKYSLVGFKTRARKNPFIIQRLDCDSQYVINEALAKKLFGQEKGVENA